MKKHKIQKIVFTDTGDSYDFMNKIGVSKAGCGLMAEKCFQENILVKTVTCGEANILKQEMLVLGGDAAIHKDVITGRADDTDVLLVGSSKQLKKLSQNLKHQSFSLPAIGKKIKKFFDTSSRSFRFRDSALELGKQLGLMGIVNVTPDSFSDGGAFLNPERAAERALELGRLGADIVDIGGESSRPGADEVSAEEETRRVLPVLEKLEKKVPCPVSIDTRKPEVAAAALRAGAGIVNDISGFTKPGMLETAVEYQAGIIIMHMQGNPRTMQKAPVYDNIIDDILNFLELQADQAVKAGIREDGIMVDPGIGFGKTAEDNLMILKYAARFKILGFPVLIGASRKSFIGKVLKIEIEQRLPADITVTAFCAMQKIDMVRIHDMREGIIARDMVNSINNGNGIKK